MYDVGTGLDQSKEQMVELGRLKTQASFLSFISDEQNFALVQKLIQTSAWKVEKGRRNGKENGVNTLPAQEDLLNTLMNASEIRSVPPRKGEVGGRCAFKAPGEPSPKPSTALDTERAVSDQHDTETQHDLFNGILDLRRAENFPEMEKALRLRFQRSSLISREFAQFYTTEVLGLPGVFEPYVYPLIASLDCEEIVRVTYVEFSKSCRSGRAFDIIGKMHGSECLEKDDFTPLIQAIVSTCDEYAMLRGDGVDEFYKRFVTTCVEAIFFVFDADDDGKVRFCNFRRLNFLAQVEALSAKIQTFNCFNYDAFYVTCRLFDQLDADNDGCLSLAEFEGFANHSLSSLVLKRIFEDGARKLATKSHMSYADFVRFVLCEEEKGAPAALRFWFACLDEGGDGRLSAFECERFFSLNRSRLELIDNEGISFDNWSQLMQDIFGKKSQDYSLAEWQERPQAAVCMINSLTNVQKFREFLNRDPYLPSPQAPFTDIHRFFTEQYVLLSNDAEDEEQDGEIDRLVLEG